MNSPFARHEKVAIKEMTDSAGWARSVRLLWRPV